MLPIFWTVITCRTLNTQKTLVGKRTSLSHILLQISSSNFIPHDIYFLNKNVLVLKFNPWNEVTASHIVKSICSHVPNMLANLLRCVLSVDRRRLVNTGTSCEHCGFWCTSRRLVNINESGEQSGVGMSVWLSTGSWRTKESNKKLSEHCDRLQTLQSSDQLDATWWKNHSTVSPYKASKKWANYIGTIASSIY